jgi:hypothetical protein
VKNCLATFGTLVLLIAAASALLLAPLYVDELADLALQFGAPLGWLEEGEVITRAGAGQQIQPESNLPALPTPGSIEITNLVSALPPATPTSAPTATPLPTPTPIPDPVQYRTRVMIRLRHFSTALQIFMDTSRRLDGDANLLNDQAWRSEIQAALDEFVDAAVAMGAVEPLPPEYAGVDEWLDRAGGETKNLREHYRAGMDTGNRQYFEAVGASLDQIIAYMGMAQQEMVAAGWGP